jgi:uncharacterized protein (TIRG00374 family)
MGVEIPNRKIQKINVKRALVTIVLVLAVAGGLAAILLREDLDTIYDKLISADLRLVGIAVGLYFFEVLFWAYRWRVALMAAGYNLSFRRSYVIAHSGMFFSNITPFSKSLGEPFRAYLIKKIQKVPYSTGFATIFAEGILTIPTFLGFLLAGMVFLIRLQSPPILVSAVILGTIICLLVAFVPLAYSLVKRKVASGGIFRIMRWISRRLGRKTSDKKIMEPIKRFYASTRIVLHDRKKAVTISIISLLLNLVSMIRIWIILFAFPHSVNPPLAAPLLAVTIPLLVGIIPFLPGGLVLVEASMVGVFVACGISWQIAVSATLVERSISYLLSTIVGAGATSYLGIKMWKTSKT